MNPTAKHEGNYLKTVHSYNFNLRRDELWITQSVTATKKQGQDFSILVTIWGMKMTLRQTLVLHQGKMVAGGVVGWG